MNYALANSIIIGSLDSPLYQYDNAKIILNSAKGVFSLDVIGSELSIDTFTVIVRYTPTTQLYKLSDGKIYKLVGDQLYSLYRTKPKDYLKNLPFGVPVWWYIDNSFWVKGYLKSVDRVSKYGFKLTCVSGVGLLDSDTHVGGLYLNTPIATVLSSIIGSAFTYTVSNAVQSTYIYGRLPYDTRRNNLHRLLFATGAALTKGDANTDYIIDFLSETIVDVPASRVALQGSMTYQLPSNRVEVTEHAFFYLASNPTETLFDNTSETAADHLTVIFKDAVYVSSLATTGSLVINESGVNYAIVTGLGTLTGKYYTHTTQIDVLENNPNNAPIRVRRVTENQLITALNARNVARRVLSYYQSAKTVKAKILLENEKCGQLLRMTDTFGDVTQAYLSRMDTLVTSVIGAQCQLVEGYSPANNGNNFLHRQAITSNGTFTVPAGVTFIRVALIGGGSGGSGGYDGEEGAYKYKGTDPIWDPGEPGGEVSREWQVIVEDYSWMYYVGYGNQEQRTPAGGNPGSPGTQGKVYVIERAVTPGEVLTFNIGRGGAGGARNGGAGAAGTATTVSSSSIGSASSASGVVAQGYFDPFNGDVYATAGRSGYKGGSGGRTDNINFYGNQGGSGLSGASVAGYTGGAGGTGMTRTLGGSYESKASGGGGGGAAYGANGSPGGSSVYVAAHRRDDDYWVGARLTSGAGGNGANASPFSKPTYGNGGGAGNGGGGGGNCGGIAGFDGYYLNQDATEYKHQGGAAGLGSIGGAGGDGIGIIYW